MGKCVKADLTDELEREVCSSFSLPSFDKTLTVLIRDGMGIIQSLDVFSVWDADTFIYMIYHVPISCLRATFSFSRFDRFLKVIPIKDIFLLKDLTYMNKKTKLRC
jgi:hypothetical protein